MGISVSDAPVCLCRRGPCRQMAGPSLMKANVTRCPKNKACSRPKLSS